MLRTSNFVFSQTENNSIIKLVFKVNFASRSESIEDISFKMEIKVKTSERN